MFNFLRKIDDSLVISIENLRFFNVGKFASETMAEYASLVCVITHSRSLSAVLAVTNAQTQPDRLYMHANTVSCLVPDVITVLVFRADADKLLIVINSRINYPPLSSLLVATVYYRSVTQTVDHQISVLGLNIMCFPLCTGGTPGS